MAVRRVIGRQDSRPGGSEHFPVAAAIAPRCRPRQPADVSQRRMIAASLGWAAMAIAAALLAEKETAPHNGSRVVRAQGLARP